LVGNHIDFRTEGFQELERVIARLGTEVPRKVSRAAARAGGKAELDFARLKAPVGHGWQHKIRRYKDEDGKHRAELLSQGTYGITGLLLKGIINAEENSGATNPNKAAFDIRMDKTLTPFFIRKVGDKRYYYPASMEYGFAGKGKGGTKQKVFAGYHFLRDSASEHSEFIHRQMEQKAVEGIDKILNSR
jgi:hypothetical protein